MFPKSVHSTSQRNDVQVIFEARKYCAILVTADGASKSQPHGILGARSELLSRMDVRVVTDVEALELVEAAIKNRDEMACLVAQISNEPIPEWVGAD